ncbi:MAG: flagellar assembly protein FliW [Oscillospiraceae bacterium]|nr:flagellar assembly protein FliW [Oscillospiraceae bacterium]
MIIKTRDFGEEEISEEVIIDFPNGVYAFEENKRFVLLSPCGEDKYPMWLQSVDNPNLCFIVFDPREFVPDYSVELDKETKELLKADGAELDLLCMAVVPDEYINTTLNLKSPIVINSTAKKGVQVIAAENYPLKFPAFKKEGA